MAKLVKQHDEIAKKFLTDLTTAKEFLQIHLDPKIQAKSDLSTLTIEHGSYIDSDLRKRFSDIVYKMDLLDKSSCMYVYVLIEHQSKAEELMPLRVLRYVLAILQKHISEHEIKGDLPLVVPLILYNGTDSPYPYTTNIAELFEDQELIKEFPIGSFSLVDLTVIPDEEILQHGKIALLEMLHKHIKIRDFTNAIGPILNAVITAYNHHISKELFDSALSYMIKGREGKELQPLLEKIVDNISEYEEDIMTYAEELRQEGEQRGIEKGIEKGFYMGEEKGKQKGKQEAQVEIAKEMLKKGLDQSLVAEITKLSIDQLRTLN